MNWKWGGKMNRGKCIYYVEGPCEQQLISALKEAPEKLIPGKILWQIKDCFSATGFKFGGRTGSVYRCEDRY